jgi:hypothetical protein
VARHDPAVAGHPWLDRATAYCLQASAELAAVAEPFAIELAFAVRLLDVAAHRYPAAAELLPVLGRHIPASGLLPVIGGTEGETIRPLDYAPNPDGAARSLFAADVIATELKRLAEQQRPDGGWEVDFTSYSRRRRWSGAGTPPYGRCPCWPATASWTADRSHQDESRCPQPARKSSAPASTMMIRSPHGPIIS